MDEYRTTRLLQKTALTFVIVIMLMAGIQFAKQAYASDDPTHSVEIVNMGLGLVNTALLIIMAAVLIKLDEDACRHHMEAKVHHESATLHHTTVENHHTAFAFHIGSKKKK